MRPISALEEDAGLTYRRAGGGFTQGGRVPRLRPRRGSPYRGGGERGRGLERWRDADRRSSTPPHDLPGELAMAHRSPPRSARPRKARHRRARRGLRVRELRIDRTVHTSTATDSGRRALRTPAHTREPRPVSLIRSERSGALTCDSIGLCSTRALSAACVVETHRRPAVACVFFEEHARRSPVQRSRCDLFQWSLAPAAAGSRRHFQFDAGVNISF